MDLLEECAREKVGMKEDWITYSFRCLPEHPQKTELVEVVGAVVPMKTTGKEAGKPNWDKKDKTTIRTAYITLKEHADFVENWQIKTGLCSKCKGSAQEFWGWSADTGPKYRPCSKCGATGKSNIAVSQPGGQS